MGLKKVKLALNWLFYKQSIKLHAESEKIRDDLLQESFTIRRGLEALKGEHRNLLNNQLGYPSPSFYPVSSQLLNDYLPHNESPNQLPNQSFNTSISEHIKRVENFHHSLVELSDRLFPIYIEESLPLSIQCLLDSCFIAHPHISVDFDMPSSWRKESAQFSLLTLRTIQELVSLTVPTFSDPLSVYINLKDRKNIRELTLEIIYPDISTLLFYSSLPELKYLSSSWEFLISGKCFYHVVNYKGNYKIAWFFCW
ncbi:MAG: hypothetical protein VKL02_13820 [Cylindrospermopsis raciborskii 1523720]|uniref:hypothetical protein n=1 Tax=Cylindrospermopsis raciborskii TaxID=77022 RepID=UPI002B4711F2|nr:hypothetical protein [Cylindrospermopsis raciborskii]MEB3147196.1 hypothetical protein [Cylindrospermopsis raciborskii]